MKTTGVLSIALSCTIFNQFLFSVALPAGYKLELLQVVFRHGDRVPLQVETYKTDPYVDLYKEIGWGQLTKIGKMRAYEVGEVLRERYDSFLGDYRAEEIYAYSTDSDRTKISLQLALAGLYPPTSKTTWNEEIRWNPIATHYDPIATNFLSSRDSCQRYSPLVREVEQLPEYQKKLEKYGDFFAYIKNSTKISEVRIFRVFLMQQNIRAIRSLGLPMPEWCSDCDYKTIEEIAALSYDTLTHTNFMTRLGAGPMVERFLKNIKDSDSADNQKKIYLYCAHDVNLATLERAHKFTDIPAIPDYGSAIIIEKLRGSDDQVYVRMLLWTGAGEELLPLKINGSSEPCPLSDYENFIERTLPDDEVRECIAKGPRPNRGIY